MKKALSAVTLVAVLSFQLEAMEKSELVEVSIKKGRPDKVCPAWDGFLRKYTDDQKRDVTVFQQGSLPRVKNPVFNELQQGILKAIKKEDFVTLNQCMHGGACAELKERIFLDAVLDLLWDTNFKVKAGAVYVLAELTKQEPLPDYVYRVWDAAATEDNYTYNAKPNFADLFQCWIKQLGIHNVEKDKRVGFAHATMPVNAVSYPLFRRTMDEEFFVVSGEGEFFLLDNNGPEHLPAQAGSYFANPHGMHVQFRNIGSIPLTMLVTTQPPFDEVIKNSGDLEKEVSIVPYGMFPYQGHAAVVSVAQEAVKKLLALPQGKSRAAQELANPDVSYLRRALILEAATQEDFVAEKMAIAANSDENWYLRKDAICALPAQLATVRSLLETVRQQESGLVKRAAESNLIECEEATNY